MKASIEAITSEALHLSPDQRLTLAHRILTSVEPALDAQVESEWETEIQARIRKYDAGLSTGIPSSRVFAELDEKLKR
ncbi:MAG: addiction module protein [bacterium]|nr:addiction module protein [bacterium]